MSRRRLLLAALAALVVVAAGAWYWDATRFPATEERVAGTPFTLRLQDGLSPQAVAVFRRGLVAEQDFLRERVGRPIIDPLEARLAHGDPCEAFGDAGGGATGVEREEFLCIDALVPVWRDNVREDPAAAASAPAHEAVHRWQRELGCDRHEDEHVWLTEGGAMDFAWRALVHAGLTSEAATGRAIRRSGALDGQVGPLRRYETESGADPEYFLWPLAVRDLLRRAPGGPLAMLRFCEAVGRGTPWRTAFAAAFGLSVGRFYREFEAARPGYEDGSRPL